MGAASQSDRVCVGAITGAHRSTRYGTSVDFADFEYCLASGNFLNEGFTSQFLEILGIQRIGWDQRFKDIFVYELTVWMVGGIPAFLVSS